MSRGSKKTPNVTLAKNARNINVPSCTKTYDFQDLLGTCSLQKSLSIEYQLKMNLELIFVK